MKTFKEWLTEAKTPAELGGEWPYAGKGGMERAHFGDALEDLAKKFSGEERPRLRRGIRRWKDPEEVIAPEFEEEDDWEEEEEELPRKPHGRWGREIAGKIKEPEFDDFGFDYEDYDVEDLGPEDIAPIKSIELDDPEEARFELTRKEVQPKTDWQSKYELRSGRPQRSWKKHRKQPWREED